MKTALFLIAPALLCGCATTKPPQWNATNDATEAEYQPYLVKGSGALSGQAFLVQRGGGVVKAAGREVTLDPATTVGDEWWEKAGAFWQLQGFTPPSTNFHKARRTTVADADGRFKFTNLPGGDYYVRTSVTWEVPGPYYMDSQGGLVGLRVVVKADEPTEIVINKLSQPYLPQPRPATVQSPKDAK